jgi:uncharacterized protein with HEPN domain
MWDEDIRNVSEILAAAQLVRSFVKGIEAPAYTKDVMRQKAVNGQIWVMAAAAKRVSEKFKSEHSRIPWEDIIRMGELVLRSGEGVAPHTVFHYARKSVPELILMISGLVHKNREVTSQDR